VPTVALAQPAELAFTDLIAPGPDLAPSSKARALAGHRVRMVGFMAHMEVPPTDGFFLTPRPVTCDEAGGGTADLPLETVLVIMPSAHTGRPPLAEGPLAIAGTFELGNQPDGDGRVSAFRIVLDDSDAPLLTATNAR
jgi:hypothetical protein